MGWYATGPGELEFRFGDLLMPLWDDVDLPDEQAGRLAEVLRNAAKEIDR